MSSSGEITIKLLVDVCSKKVLFAEAGNDFVDYIFSLLTLPLSSVISLVSPYKLMLGTIGKLYQSVEQLSETYLRPGREKAAVLRPKILSPLAAINSPLLLSGSPEAYITPFLNTECPSCKHSMNSKVSVILPSVSSSSSPTDVAKVGKECGGFVQEMVTYMITDDLEVTPMTSSAISSILLLNRFSVKTISAKFLESVQLYISQGLALLQASLKSTTVLTDVFYY
ncbi:hypothetical protein AXF42_Ash008708 [Apostasia shenzhenica]|uniref:Uncharacterized protein n=1 Tax=Apostasia shenzhenica TaxID=1088818 RepID=A0A2I0B273_9ASPA|nr:hypothetical protein AXF42_Ash008708 [Apostasia shenzhenica]